MCGHRLGVLQRAAGFEISRDPGGSEGVAADLHARAEIGRTPLDHAPGIDAVHRLVGQSAGAIGSRAEEGGLAAIADTGDLYPILFTA
jgi:hypothetical protein